MLKNISVKQKIQLYWQAPGLLHSFLAVIWLRKVLVFFFSIPNQYANNIIKEYMYQKI